MAVDFKSLNKYDQGALVAGAVAVVLSFIGSYVTASIDAGDDLPGVSYDSGTNAWDSFATLGMLLVILAVAVVAVKAFAAGSLPAGVPWNLVAFAAAALGTVLLVLRAFTYGDGGAGALGVDVSVGPGWSGWLLFIATIALSVFAFLSFKASGEKIPEINRKDGTPPPAA